MPIRRGEPWGHERERPRDAVVVTNDAELASLAECDGRHGAVIVAGGDLWRSLGAPADRDPVQLLPIDLLEVVVDGDRHLAAAHVLARTSWWRGPILAVLNVGSMGDWEVAPRAHPNDGRMDVVQVDESMSIRQRWVARSRLPLGTHLPHPAISVRSLREGSWHFDRAVRVWLDGRPIGSARSIEVRVLPDALTIAA